MLVELRFEIGHEVQPRADVTPDGHTHDLVVFLRGASNTEIHHFVKKVVFKLPMSFPDPIRVLSEPPYVIRTSGHVSFTVPIEVHFQADEEPRKVKFDYDLCIENGDRRTVEWTLADPSEEFTDKLLRGGGNVQVKLEEEEESPSVIVENHRQLLHVSPPDKNELEKLEEESLSENVENHRRRQLPASDRDKEELPYEEMKRIIKSLQRMLECEFCYNTLPRNTLTCVNGHCICADCRHGKVYCPTCGECFSNIRQNALAQQVSNLIPKICQFENCLFMLGPEDDHELYCGHRPTLCRECSKEQFVAVRDLEEHFKHHHAAKFIRGNSGTIRLTVNYETRSNARYTFLIKTDFEHFLWEHIMVNKATEVVEFQHDPVLWGRPGSDLRLKFSTSSEQLVYEVSAKIDLTSGAKNAFGLMVYKDQMHEDNVLNRMNRKSFIFQYSLSEATPAEVRQSKSSETGSSTCQNGSRTPLQMCQCNATGYWPFCIKNITRLNEQCLKRLQN